MPRIRVTSMQVMDVAPAERRAALAAAQSILPERHRIDVLAVPGTVPDLHRMDAFGDGVLPRGPERLGMAHAGDRAAFRRGAHGALDRSGLGLAELPPAVSAPSIPVTAVRGDLDTWHDDR